MLPTAILSGPRPRLDPRSHIARPDIVDIALAGHVAAARYVEPLPMRCKLPRTAMRGHGDAASTAVSELLFGEIFDVFDVAGDWAFGRSAHDRYTGWVHAAALTAELGDAVHSVSDAILSVTAAAAPLFSAADIKSPVIAELPFGARLAGTMGNPFLAVEGGGFLHNRHLAALPSEPVEVARRFTGAPYLWGGRTPAGVDCSGLVQMALSACGIAAPRDSDQQRDELGMAVAFDRRSRGDIVFFLGHVGILVDADTLFHANAFWMSVVEEPLADVISRLRDNGVAEPVTAVKRVQAATLIFD